MLIKPTIRSPPAPIAEPDGIGCVGVDCGTDAVENGLARVATGTGVGDGAGGTVGVTAVGTGVGVGVGRITSVVSGGPLVITRPSPDRAP